MCKLIAQVGVALAIWFGLAVLGGPVLPLLDNLQPHQTGEVRDVLEVVAVEDDPVQ